MKDPVNGCNCSYCNRSDVDASLENQQAAIPLPAPAGDEAFAASLDERLNILSHLLPEQDEPNATATAGPSRKRKPRPRTQTQKDKTNTCWRKGYAEGIAPRLTP
jgi:hypothetical protein